MDLLNERLTKLLEYIIRDYIKTAEPVGSTSLVEDYDLDISPATVRNEMVKLGEYGFLDKPHFSAGRIPTAMAFRYFIKNIMEEKDLPVVEEVNLKEQIWKTRQDPSLLVENAVQSLADTTNHLSFALINETSLYHRGVSYILDHPEFYNIDLTKTVLQLLDHTEMIQSIFNKIPADFEEGILLGKELGSEELSECGLVFARIRPTRKHEGFLSVMGPIRLKYPYILPRLRYLQGLINQIGKNL